MPGALRLVLVLVMWCESPENAAGECVGQGSTEAQDLEFVCSKDLGCLGGAPGPEWGTCVPLDCSVAEQGL